VDIANWLGSRPGRFALFVRSTGRTFLVIMCHALISQYILTAEMELDWKAKRRVATLSPFANSQRGRGVDLDFCSTQYPIIACSYPFAKFNSNLAPHPYH
jgi:hypothetical protein